MTETQAEAEKAFCPKCKILREEIKYLRAIAKEAAEISALLNRWELTDELAQRLNALDFELIEYDMGDWADD